MSERDPQTYLDVDHLQEDLEDRTVRGGVLTAGAQVTISLLNVGSTLVLARLLLPKDFGLLGMVIAITGFLDMFKDLGLSMATVQRDDIDHAQVSNLFWINAAISVALTAITAAIAPLLAWFYDKPQLLPITLSLAAGFILSGLGIQHKAILKRQMRFRAVALVEFAAMVVAVGSAIWTAWAGWGFWALVVKHLSLATVGTAAAWWACGWRPGWANRQTEVGELLKFGGNLTGFSLINHFSRNLDDVLIGKVWGAAPLGFYQKAYEILMAPLQQINKPLRSVAVPMLSRLVDQPKRYRRNYLRILEKIVMLTMPLGVLMIAAADWIVLVVLGEKWLPAAAIFRALGVGVFAQPIGNSTGWLFVSQDRTDDMMRWGIIGSTLAMIAFVAGLPWGTLGVAAVYSISGLMMRTPLLLWFVGRDGPIQPSHIYKMVWPFVLSAAGCAAALWYFRAHWSVARPIYGLAISIGITISSTLLVLLVIPRGRRAMADIKQVVRMWRET